MDEEVRIDMAVIKEKINNLSDQFKRFVSHLESEQRVTNNISKRVDQMEHVLNRMEIVKDRQNLHSKWKAETVISIVCAVAAILSVVVSFIGNGSQ